MLASAEMGMAKALRGAAGAAGQLLLSRLRAGTLLNNSDDGVHARHAHTCALAQ